MLIYIVVFFISCTFTAIAQYSVKRKQLGAFFLLSSIAVLFPALLAAFRDPGVGTDSAGYCLRTWNGVLRYHDFNVLLELYNNGYFPEVEYIYLLLNWLVSLVTDDIHILFFVLNLIIVGFVYKAAYDNRHRAEMWMVMLCFYLLFYSNTLNLMRQYIAVAIGMYAFKFFESRNWKKLIIWILIMMMWHSTTIVYIGMICFNMLLNSQNKKVAKGITIASAFTLYILFLYFDEILLFIVRMRILPDRFTAYLKQYSAETFFDTSSTIAAMVMLFFFICVYRIVIEKCKKKEIEIFIKNKSIAIVLNLTSLISTFVFRMSYYFSIVTDCLFLPRTLFMLKKRNKPLYTISSFMFVVLFIALFYLLYVKNGINQTVPYRSSILGIE